MPEAAEPGGWFQRRVGLAQGTRRLWWDLTRILAGGREKWPPWGRLYLVYR